MKVDPLLVDDMLASKRLALHSEILRVSGTNSSVALTDRRLWELAERSRPLVQCVATRTHKPANLWFLTAAGHDASETTLYRDKPRVIVTAATATGNHQAHAIAVNDVGVAFVTAARARGDECEPFAWRHEVDHELSGIVDGRRIARGIVRSDALLHYTHWRDDGSAELLSRLIELDRATTPLDVLVTKMRRYARVFNHVAPGEQAPAWREQYPAVFPQVLVVFAGMERHPLERRMHMMPATIAKDPEVVATGPGFVVAACLLSDLVSKGPFAPVFYRHDDLGVAGDWMGVPAPDATRGPSVAVTRAARSVESRRDASLYFVRGADMLKIGYASGMAGRLSAHRANSPVPVTIYRRVRTSVAPMLEKVLHARYAEHRRQGEWFLAAPVLAEIDAMTDDQIRALAPEGNATTEAPDPEFRAGSQVVRPRVRVPSPSPAVVSSGEGGQIIRPRRPRLLTPDGGAA